MAPPIIESVNYGEIDIVGKRLCVRSLRVNGIDEMDDFVRSFAASPVSPRDKKFLDKLIDYIRVVADESQNTPNTVFRRLTSSGGLLWPDQWEIRIKQADKNHRFYGFMARGEFLVAAYRDKQAQRADPRVLEFVKEVREYWLRVPGR